MAMTERQRAALQRQVEEARDRHDRIWTRTVRDEENGIREANVEAERRRSAFRIVP